MPVKRLRRSKAADEGSRAGVRRKTLGGKETANKDEQRGSQIPVPRKRGRLSLASKFNPTVDIKEVPDGLKVKFFHGDEKELFKTPLKAKLGEKQEEKQQSTRGKNSSSKPKKGKKETNKPTSSPSSNHTSPSSSPYFLRSKGPLDETMQPEKLSSDISNNKDEKNKRNSYGHRKAAGADKVTANREKPNTVDKKVEKLELVGPVKPLPKNKQMKINLLSKLNRNSFAKLVSVSKASQKVVKSLNTEDMKIPTVEIAKEDGRGKKRKRDEYDENDDDLLGKTVKVVIIDANLRKGVTVRRSDSEQHSAISSAVVAVRKEDNEVENVEERKDEPRDNVSSNMVTENHEYSSGREEEAMVINVHDEPLFDVPLLSASSSHQNDMNTRCNAKDFKQFQKDSENVEGCVSSLEYDPVKTLTSDISARSSWSAHLYDASIAFTPVQEKLSTERDIAQVSIASKAIDLQKNWDMSVVKNQLINSVTPPRFRGVGDEAEFKKITVDKKSTTNGIDRLLHNDSSCKERQNINQTYHHSGIDASETVAATNVPSFKVVGLSLEPGVQARRSLLDVGSFKEQICAGSEKACPQNVLKSRFFQSRENERSGNGKVVPNGDGKSVVKTAPSRHSYELRKFLRILGFPVLVIGIVCFLYLVLAFLLHY